MYTLDDTIAAISTPIGQGGIGIVRLSGPDAVEIANRLFVPAKRDSWTNIEPFRLYYGHIVDPSDKHIVDEVLLSYMRAPRSYTRQDVIEINAHGGVVPLQEILRLCLESGARMAREGEFTLRAFVNGRIDLAQAEAVLDVIQAKTDAALQVAIGQLSGHLSREVGEMRQQLLSALAYLEASIDFPEEDIPVQDVSHELSQVGEQLKALLASADRGIIYRQGVRAAIVGRPNVGKSSLLNALLRVERAIVTPIPGTTRDTLEETINLQGIPVVLVDTAGIETTEDPIERLGIERSRRSIQGADLVLMVVDISSPLTAEDTAVAALIEDKPAIMVLNKIDLGLAADFDGLLPQAPRVRVSALTGHGIPALEETLLDVLLSGQVIAGEPPISGNSRHRALLQIASDYIHDALTAIRSELPAECVAIDIREAIDALGEITGETANQDLLETIFGRFCIGK